MVGRGSGTSSGENKETDVSQRWCVQGQFAAEPRPRCCCRASLFERSGACAESARRVNQTWARSGSGRSGTLRISTGLPGASPYHL